MILRMTSAFRKSMLQVGTYHSPDGVVEVTPDRLTHWEAEFQRLSTNGYDVPVAWDHGSTAATLSPVSREAVPSARNTVGRLKTFVVAADGQSAEITLELTDPRGAEQAASNRVQVSPVILPRWRDGKGNTYQDVLTHFDLVNHAVDHSQTPFVPARLSTDALALQPVRFSLPSKDDALMPVAKLKPEELEDGTAEPRRDRSDATADAMPDELSASDDVAPDEAAVENAMADPTMEQNNQETLVALDRVASLLRGQGIVLDAASLEGATDLSTFLASLEQAISKKQAAIDASTAKSSSSGPPEVSEPGPQMLSTHSLATLRRYAEGLHRERLARRLTDLRDSGRCTPAEYDRQRSGLIAIKLSLDGVGNPLRGDLEQWIDHREELPAFVLSPKADGKPLTRLSSDGVLEPPADLMGEEDDDATEAAARAQLERTHRLRPRSWEIDNS